MSDQFSRSQSPPPPPEEESTAGGAGARSGTSKMRERLEDFERTLRKAVSEAEQTVRTGIKTALPAEATKHLSNSKREFLLFVRSIVDAEIDRSDKRRNEGQAKGAEEKTEE